MRYFKLNISLILVSIVVVSAFSGIMFFSGKWPQASLFLLLDAVLIASLYALISRLVHVMSSFVTALEANDTTLRIDTANSKGDLREMGKSMNRILILYNSNMRELETRKLYYDRILRIMTHEMRNTITPIMSLSSDMHAHPESYSGESLREASGIICSQSEGIKKFLDSYHRLTHLPVPEIKEIESALFFKRLKRMSESFAAEEGYDISNIKFLMPVGSRIGVDEGMMLQVMQNILKNSTEAAAACGKNPEITVTLTSGDGNDVIMVEDNGGGLSPKAAENAFQPFFTTKTSGTGIGLFLSRQIMRLHNGDLKLRNNPGKGLTVVISLPSIRRNK